MARKDTAEIIIRFDLENTLDKKIYGYIVSRNKNKYPYYKNYITEAIEKLIIEEDRRPITKSEMEDLLDRYILKQRPHMPPQRPEMLP